MIELRNVTVAFKNEIVLHKINLTVQKGEVFVIVGPSGHGKTTMLKTSAGLIVPQDGEVIIENKNINKINPLEKKALLKKMGMLFQKNALFDSWTCGENIAFPLRENSELSEAEINEKVEFFLNAVGISHALKLFPDEISGGMQKRLGIARALALNPEILFYDDPTAGLDPITSKKIIDLIKELQVKNHTTVMAVTNDMNRAYQMADQLGLVANKTILLTGNSLATKNHSEPIVQQFVLGKTSGPLS